MKTINIFYLAALLIAVSGCASAPSFVKPAPDKLGLGKSTGAEVLQTLKTQPATQSDVSINGEKVKVLNYFYGENPKFWGLLISRRYQSYTLYNDILVGDEFTSTFEGESTEFDTDKIASIEKGKTTRAEVVALMGKPSGEVSYPIVIDKKWRGLVYSYIWSRFAGILTTSTSHLLVVSIDENNIVSNVSFKKDGVEQIKG